ncbi:MAG: carbon starvation protein A [bacterium]|nr:carbon starvation protein A [bacterium]
MLAVLFLGGVTVLFGGYLIYTRILDRKFEVNATNPVPAETERDDVDYVPTRTPILFGHHFASIAGAGPIVGPIVAAMLFGWVPALLWILLGTTLIGGMHDYVALMASIRHRGRSIGEVTGKIISPVTQKILLVFLWLTLIYVLVVFLNLTATTFAGNGGVASSSAMFIVLAILFGLWLYRFRLPALGGTLLFVPLTFLAVYLGQQVPLSMPEIGGSAVTTWSLILIVYCYIASVTPVGILLQPRDYLSSFLLYALVLGSAIGLLFGGFDIAFTPFIGFRSPAGPLFPILFVVIACGAVSGFHSVIASGTTAKQLASEKDIKRIGFGAMAVEGGVALIALATVIILGGDSEVLAAYRAHEIQATGVFARGMGQFAAVFGVSPTLGAAFGALAISTFLLTTLDTVTRLGRFIFHEFFGIKRVQARYLSTLATVIVPTVMIFLKFHDAQGNSLPIWKAVWPVFGATNQLLAGLTLLIITVWLKRQGKSALFTAIPTVFMILVTLSGFVYLVAGGKQNTLVEGIAIALFCIAIVLISLCVRKLREGRPLD